MASIGNVVSIDLTASDISILSRVNADVTGEPEVKYANQKTRNADVTLKPNVKYAS